MKVTTDVGTSYSTLDKKRWPFWPKNKKEQIIYFFFFFFSSTPLEKALREPHINEVRTAIHAIILPGSWGALTRQSPSRRVNLEKHTRCCAGMCKTKEKKRFPLLFVGVIASSAAAEVLVARARTPPSSRRDGSSRRPSSQVSLRTSHGPSSSHEGRDVY